MSFVCSDWPGTAILLISVAQVGKIAGVSHRCPALRNDFFIQLNFPLYGEDIHENHI
jgi:hypothetical protein